MTAFVVSCIALSRWYARQLPVCQVSMLQRQLHRSSPAATRCACGLRSLTAHNSRQAQVCDQPACHLQIGHTCWQRQCICLNRALYRDLVLSSLWTTIQPLTTVQHFAAIWNDVHDHVTIVLVRASCVWPSQRQKVTDLYFRRTGSFLATSHAAELT